MENIFYLIVVSVCVTGFYIVYFFIFRHIAAFRLNRVFLIAALVSSFFIPAMDLSFVPPDYHSKATILISDSSMGALEFYSNTVSLVSEPGDFSFLSVIYWTGLIIFSLRILYGVNRIIHLRHRSLVAKTGSLSIVYADISQPFSFFNLIFLPKEGTDELILEHEKIHVRHYHWIDLVAAEIASAILWFNPVIFLYKKSLKIQHEYEADASVLSNGIKVENYLNCMLRHLTSTSTVGLVSSFYSQNIKQRILMMTQKKATLQFKLLYLLFVPVLCGLMFAFADFPVKTNQVIQSLTPLSTDDIVVVVDAGHGGQDRGGYSNETNEKDVVLSIAKDIQKAGEKAGVKVIVTRTGDESLSLEERLSIAARNRANMFLSIHVNFDPDNASTSGIDVIVSDENKEFEKSNRVAGQLKSELSQLEGIRVNAIKNSNFYVLSKNTIPATLLEIGHLSNKADHAYITDSKNQRKVSESIINAIVTSFK